MVSMRLEAARKGIRTPHGNFGRIPYKMEPGRLPVSPPATPKRGAQLGAGEAVA